MNQPHHQNQENAQEESGIDLRQLFGRVAGFVRSHYQKLRLWLAITAVLVVGVFVLALFRSPPMTTYAESVEFNFSQSERGLYPNGSPFSITDLTNRNVLEQVWRENKLESQGIPFQDFSESVSIVPYADNAPFIKAKYESMLARKQLNSTDITAIERDYRAELEGQSKKSALLSLTVPFSSPLSGSLARKVLSDIPRAWSDQAINRLGVIAIPLADTESVQDEILKKGSPFQILDYFYKSAAQLNITVNRIEGYAGGTGLKDPETGWSVEDISRRIADLTRYWILDFDNYVQQSQRVSEIDVRSAEIHLKELKDRQQELQASAQTYKVALQDYDALARQNKVASAQEYSGAYRSQAGAVQLDGNSVQKLIDLGSKDKDADFRQDLTKKRVQAELQAKAMDQEILRYERRIAAAKNAGGKGAADPEKMKYYEDEIWKQLQAISGSIQRIQLEQQNKYKDGDGQLYSAGAVTKGYASGVAARFFLPIGLLVLIGLLGLGAYLIKRLSRETTHG